MKINKYLFGMKRFFHRLDEDGEAGGVMGLVGVELDFESDDVLFGSTTVLGLSSESDESSGGAGEFSIFIKA